MFSASADARKQADKATLDFFGLRLTNKDDKIRAMKLLILFGSRARGTMSANSDADVAVLAERPLSFEEKDKLRQELAERLRVSEDQIDLVDLRTAPPLLQQQIASTGRLIDGRAEDFIRFRVLAWKRYQDTAKFRRRREQNLAQKYAT